MKFALIAATLAAAALAGCVSNPPKDPMAKDAAPYLEKPDYDYALVCDLRHDDLRKCEATLKQLCGERGYIDLRVRPLREPGAAAESSTHRLLQVQCKAR
ncbi:MULTISPECIES: hypothetical protein [Comamonas]|jgi:hypothetical protein|uniref:Lipoprotein n=1 Tax=Comamonas terrigena TaxID=32013 RepID=A0A2A7UT76_COMTR|nr:MULTISPECIES: hypothetical protein [Comamonas]MBD9532274.1 hypothetical protein [Comamonas sp. CMM01]MBV7418509.1 hypothetical protein [Comamonas sp. CMM03]MDH0050062.1 hypothetical protein [Comamonas terrigena]MDH0512714.1 hypothetical protein [Comamonas terrigena]MDH1092641.1 hypothetical protein [Comamonas terrigena]